MMLAVGTRQKILFALPDLETAPVQQFTVSTHTSLDIWNSFLLGLETLLVQLCSESIVFENPRASTVS